MRTNFGDRLSTLLKTFFYFVVCPVNPHSAELQKEG